MTLLDYVRTTPRRVVFEDTMKPEETDIHIEVEGWEAEVTTEVGLVGITTTVRHGATGRILSEHTVTAHDWRELE